MIKLHASFQSSPKIKRLLIKRLICIQQKSSRFLSPVSTVSAMNAWDHGQPFEEKPKKTPACLESRSAKASSTNKFRYVTLYWEVQTSRSYFEVKILLLPKLWNVSVKWRLSCVIKFMTIQTARLTTTEFTLSET